MTITTVQIDCSNSSCFVNGSYDFTNELLTLTFQNNGYTSTYEYNCPTDVFNQFIDSSSLGGYFNRFIRPVYEGIMVDQLN